MKNKLLILVVLCFFALVGCKSKRQVVTTAKSDKSRELIERVMRVEPSYKTLNVQKMRMEVSIDSKDYAVNGSMQILTDSVIVISVQPLLGIEVYRAQISKNDVLVVDKLNRRYVRMDYDAIRDYSGLAIEYEDIEAVLKSKMFVVGKTDNEYFGVLSAQTEQKDDEVMISFREGRLEYEYQFGKNNLELRKSKIGMMGKTDKTEVAYLNYQAVDKTVLCTTYKINYEGDKEAKANMTLLKYDIDRGIDMRSLNLNKYTKVEITDLLK